MDVKIAEVIVYRLQQREGLIRDLVRYADDVVVTAPTKERIETYVLPKLKAFLQKRGLSLSESNDLLTVSFSTLFMVLPEPSKSFWDYKNWSYHPAPYIAPVCGTYHTAPPAV